MCTLRIWKNASNKYQVLQFYQISGNSELMHFRTILVPSKILGERFIRTGKNMSRYWYVYDIIRWATAFRLLSILETIIDIGNYPRTLLNVLLYEINVYTRGGVLWKLIGIIIYNLWLKNYTYCHVLSYVNEVSVDCYSDSITNCHGKFFRGETLYDVYVTTKKQYFSLFHIFLYHRTK